MKLVNFKRPVTSQWLVKEGRRLDANPFLSGAVEARLLLENLDVQPLHTLTKGHNGGIYNGPIFKRRYVEDPQNGVPFISSSSFLLADLSNLPLLSKKDARSRKLAYLELREGMTLISCSGTIGRMGYVRPDMAGMWSSQDVMKIVPDPDKIPPGYLYAFLSSKYGTPLVVSGTYGAIIQHIEPEHIAKLPVPRLGDRVENEIAVLIKEEALCHTKSQAMLREATALFLRTAGIDDFPPHRWHAAGSELGFVHSLRSANSMRAMNFSPRFASIVSQIRRGPHKPLGEICANGQLSRGGRFKRIPTAEDQGCRLIGQKHGFWLYPEGQWISTRGIRGLISAQDETVLVASQGTLGESEVFCRPLLVSGSWLKYGYSEHFLRIVTTDSSISGAYLFAFLRSDLCFRCFRCMSIGSKQQDIHPRFAAEFPIPIIDDGVRAIIESKVRESIVQRDLGYKAHETALGLLQESVEAHSQPSSRRAENRGG